MSTEKEKDVEGKDAEHSAAAPAEKSVGYKQPPVAHQFKKGVSGNPKGRPKKRERAWSNTQFDNDTLLEANAEIEISIGGKKVRMPTYRAIIKRINMDAVRGHLPSAKFAVRRAEQAALSRSSLHRELYKGSDAVERDTFSGPASPNDNIIGFLDYYRKKSRQT